MPLFTAKMTETLYKTAIGAAVHPLRAVAMDAAEDRARKTIARVTEELAAVGGDRTAAAPYPYHSHKMSQRDADKAKARYSLFSTLTAADPAKRSRHGMNDPYWVVMVQEKAEKFVADARDFAAGQYDAFVAKLVNKIGEHVSAVLEGNHVWGESFLTVTFAGDKAKETWKTQQIWNVSKLGKDFPQWPSRKLKVAR